MKVLLDTCTFLWVATGSDDLSPAAREAFRDPGNDVFLSVVSAWEIAVKHRLGRLELPATPERWLPGVRERHGILSLELGETTVLGLARLPDLHRDPFDRMLVCQAIAGGLTLLTPDDALRAYPAPSLW